MIPPLSSLDLRGVTDTLRRWMAGLDAWVRSMGTAARLNADADTGLTGNSDQVLPTQKAVKAYADAITAAVGAGYQPLDADLTAAAGLTTTGLVTRTGAGTMATRTLTGPAAGFTITDGNGVSGNPTFVLADDLAAVEGLSGTGMASRTAANTWALRQIAGTANEIGVTDGTGAAGNPTISLPTNITLTGKNITGGTFTGITDIAVADGGTGASTGIGALDNLFTQGATIPSATTTDLSAATGAYVIISGSTTITALGTVSAGSIRIVRFSSAPLITHNATSLSLPGGANIQAAAGDSAIFLSHGSGNWRCISYETFGALPLARGGTGASSASAARTNLGLAIGSDVQAYGALLDGLTALATTGHIVRTGAGTVAARTLTAPAAGISVSNGDGVSGNPTLALANDLAALEAMSGTGIVARTGSETYAQRTITGTANEISVANGDGVSGNPTVSLPSTIALAGKTITGLAASSVTNTAAGNIAATNVQTALNELDTEKVAKAGDTMTGALKLPVGSAAAPALVIGTGADEGLYLDASGQFRVGMGGTGYVTLSTGGNLGVGLSDTVAPSNRIHAYGSGNSRIGTHSDTGSADFQATAASNDAAGPSLVFRKDRGASTTPASVNTSDVVGNVTWQAYGGGAYRNAAQMRAVVLAASPSSTDMESEIEFRAPVSGSVTLSTLAKLGQTAGFTIGSGVVIDALRLHRLRSYTVATLPAAGTAGRLAYCSNEASGAMPVYDNGTNWIDIINGTTAA